VRTVEPFTIRVHDTTLADLHARLDDTRWERNASADWKQGVDIEYLKSILSYWRSRFDWRAEERRLNALNHFSAALDGYRIHFIHERAPAAEAMPLLLLHGWPDSFVRFLRLMPMLGGAAGADGFHLVIPSLPGFGFTESAAQRPDSRVVRHDAQLLHRLMHQGLGYDQFGIVGGDGGSVLAQAMAIDFPESVTAIYLTDLGWHVAKTDPKTLSRKEQRYLAASQEAFMTQGAYAMQQATKPQTLAFSLTDSPAGLAAWILDRFHFWTDGDIDDRFTRDDLLTNITIYWATNTIASSMRGYRTETLSPSLTPADYVSVPVGLGLFPADIGGIPPREFAERTLNVQHWTEMPRGGHFTAWEEPELMAGDLVKFFTSLDRGHTARGPDRTAGRSQEAR